MKKILPILTVLIILSCCNSNEESNDLKEYGFNGKVKSVHTTNYSNLESENGEWIIDEDRIESKWKMLFNENGFITEIREYYPSFDTVWDEVISNIEFVNGKKSTYIKTNQYGQKTETGTYTWIDNYHYTINSNQMNGTKIESHFMLNKEFRDQGGDYTYSFLDSIYFSESYVNQLKNDGEIISSSFTNALTNNEYVITYSDKEKDKKGNLVKAAFVYESSGELKRLSVREFEYYKY